MRARAGCGAALLLIVWGSVADAQMKLGEPSASASPTPAIRDIRPPLDVFPYPMWMIVTAGVVAFLILACIVIAARKRPRTPPPTPRELALRRLKEAEADLAATQPYAFSIRVSDILRRYVAEQYQLRATEQTSPEFLAAAARSPHFTKADKDLLASFLEQCDLIKFARISATTEDSAGLVTQAVHFVKGGME